MLALSAGEESDTRKESLVILLGPKPEASNIFLLKNDLNVSAPQYNSKAAKWCFCFTKCQAGLIKDGVNGQ